MTQNAYKYLVCVSVNVVGIAQISSVCVYVCVYVFFKDRNNITTQGDGVYNI